MILIDPIDCSRDLCHLAWIVRDNPHFIIKAAKDAKCSNGVKFSQFRREEFANCPVYITHREL